jgi:transcriptional regulator with XRE-family HTH domain
MSWWDYVERTAGTDVLVEIVQRTGIQSPTLSRWRSGKQGVDATSAAKFARAYGRPVLEAFVEAEFLTAEEAKQRPTAAPSLDSLTDEQLVTLIAKRLNVVTSFTGSGKTGAFLASVAAYKGTPDTEAVTKPQDEIESGNQDDDGDMEPR